MIIGVPKEIKTKENRVGLLPVGVAELKKHGHTVIVENNAGVGSGFDNDAYVKAGAEIVPTPKDVYGRADMIVKVKEPIKPEYELIRENQVVFTYFHFAADRALTEAMIKSKCIAIAYETVQRSDRKLPLLDPMSEVAGRMAVHAGAKYLEKTFGGRGLLLSGVPGTEPATVVVIGGGVVGTNAAKIAAGFGARVIMMDIDLYRLRYLDDIMPKNVHTMMSNSYNIAEVIKHADLVIGAVLIPGAKAPHLITRDMLKTMKPGAVIVDVAVDQGGCVETTKPTTHEEPIYNIDGIVHYCVANMPGAVPFTSTVALTNATLPYAVQLANKGWEKAVKENHELLLGCNILNGKVVYKGVADAFDLPYVPVEQVVK
ncbi:MAG TPA: alanine dehydrogenase [bacterium]|nr:alanine dehydrogenase [bacterium]HMW35710.1 alanine dehydrogenase [bacterium]HMZ05305.1 alanine dehydrogenase [bacterium]HNB09560.1 alanine dehydrogenase [bacterium]HNC49135.1 alanine dehydrogenase [bacterium]